MEPGAEPRGGVPCGGGDGGAPDASGASAGGGTAGEDPSEDNDWERWAPYALLAGAPEDSGSPPLCSGWCPPAPGPWAGAAPRELGERPPGAPAAGGGGGVPLICGTCGLSFEAEAELSAHQDEHRRPAPSHQCSACGKAFRHRRNLLTHKKHRGRRRHACAECGWTFCLKGDLLRHRASHGGGGGYACPLCGDRFRRKRGLQAHRRQHAGPVRRRRPRREKGCEGEAGARRGRVAEREERPFVCGRCGRSFSWRESLVIHQRSHAQERAHRCPDCGRGFSRSGNLLLHRRVHAGERPPFACPRCGEAFRRKAELAAHEKLHRRCQSFACPRCRRGFASRSKLLRHQRAHGEGEAGTPAAGGSPGGCPQ